MPHQCRLIALLGWTVATLVASPVLGQQAPVDSISAMPDIPVNYQYVDYAAVAKGFDSTAFNPIAQARYQYPTFWFQNDPENGVSRGFGMPSYIGQTQATIGNGEAITTIGAVLGASLVGINKQSQTLSDGNTYDFVQMASRYYDSGTGANLVLNNISSQGAGSFWYDQLPQILFDGLISQYYSSYAPASAGRQRLDTVMNTGAYKMHNVIDVLAGGSTTAVPNFNYQGFNYVTMQPVTGNHTEPDGAAGAGYEQYMAYLHTGNATYLSDAQRCIQALQNTPVNENPLYETVLPFGALTAARLNAEHGTNYDVAKMVNWCFSPTSVARPDWGAITDAQWGGYGVAGLIGSTTDHGGYGFSMNSYLYPMALVPLVRYDDRFASAIGKWMLNLTNSSRLFLKQTLPAANQTNASWSDAPSNYYSYEGVKKDQDGIVPQAGGDGSGYNSNWLNFAYGSGDIGVLGGIVQPTDVPMILQLDLLKTDFFHAAADPSYLLYNPYNTMKAVHIDVGSTPVNIYDAVSDQFLATNVSGIIPISIPGQRARSIVFTPVGSAIVDDGSQVSIGGVIVNYRSPELDRLYWASNASGTWDAGSANWVPHASNIAASWIAGQVATFAGGDYTITIDGPQYIGGLDFQSGNVALQGASLILDSDAAITSAGGTQTINAPISGSFGLLKNGPGTVVLGAINTYTGLTTIEQGVVRLANPYALDFTNVDVDVDGGLDLGAVNPTLGGLSGSGNIDIGNQTLTLGNDNQPAEYAGTITGSGKIIKIGAGDWTVSGKITGSINLTIDGAGVVAITSPDALSSDSNIINNGNLRISANNVARNLTGNGTLDIESGASVQLAADGGTSTQSALAIAPGASLDLANNELQINYGGAADPIASILANLTTGYADGSWTGPGINSHVAAVNELTTLGYVDDGSEIKIKFTWIGDVNLDGVVNQADLSAMAPPGTAHAVWANGDLNYDGIINGDDYALFMLSETMSRGTSISQNVPEPTAISLLAMTLFWMRRRGHLRND